MSLDEGFYLAEVMDHGFGESAKKKTPCIEIDIDITHRLNGKHEPVSEILDRPIRRVVEYATARTTEKLLDKLRYAGFEGDDFNQLDIVGRQVVVKCNHEEWTNDKGEPRVSEKFQLAFPPSARKEIQKRPDGAMKLNALFGSALKGDASATPKASAVQPDPSSSSESEVPF